MDFRAVYQSRLTTPEQAVAMIPSGARLSMGMATAEPPALLKALADRAEGGGIEDLRVYYYEATRIAGDTILRYELNDRIRPYCMFVAASERELIKRGIGDGGRKVVNYVPSTFHQAPRLLIDEMGIDAFVMTGSPMDRHGYFSFEHALAQTDGLLAHWGSCLEVGVLQPLDPQDGAPARRLRSINAFGVLLAYGEHPGHFLPR